MQWGYLATRQLASDILELQAPSGVLADSGTTDVWKFGKRSGEIGAEAVVA